MEKKLVGGGHNVLSLDEIRVKISQQTERIVSGLKDRSHFPSNQGIYSQEFHEGKSWFDYRLRKEQDLDAQFGRYEFDDQHPIRIRKGELGAPIQRRAPTEHIFLRANIEMGEEVISFYRDLVVKICKGGEDLQSYGETAKLDVQNVLLLHERICGMGPYVADAKVAASALLLELSNPKDIEARLRDKDREEKVIASAKETAARYQLPNSDAIEGAFKRIIDLTVQAEVNYILQVQAYLDQTTHAAMESLGFGHVVGQGWGFPLKTNKRRRTGWNQE